MKKLIALASIIFCMSIYAQDSTQLQEVEKSDISTVDEGNSFELWKSAKQCEFQNDYDGAIKIIETIALKFSKESSAAYLNLAELSIKKGDLERANNWVVKAKASNAINFDSMRLCDIYISLKEYQKAEEMLLQLIKSDKFLSVYNYQKLLKIYLNTNQFDKAEGIIFKMISSEFKNDPKRLGKLYLQLAIIEVINNGTKSKEYLESAVKNDPEILNIIFNPF